MYPTRSESIREYSSREDVGFRSIIRAMMAVHQHLQQRYGKYGHDGKNHFAYKGRLSRTSAQRIVVLRHIFANLLRGRRGTISDGYGLHVEDVSIKKLHG